MVLAAIVSPACGFAQLPAMPDRPLSAAERTRLASLEGQFQKISVQRYTSVAALRTIARAMGSRLTSLDPDDILKAIDQRAKALNEARARIGQLQAQLEAADSMNLARAVAPLLADAKKAIDEGRLDDASRSLAEAGDRVGQARTNLQGRLDQLSRQEADITAQRAVVRSGLFDDAGAADFYAKAADLAPAADPALVWRYRIGQARALLAVGEAGPDQEAVRRAITVMREKALPLASRDVRPTDWAETQDALGDALTTLGDLAKDPSLIDESITALRAALNATPTDAPPDLLVKRECALARALSNLGSNKQDIAMLQEAAALYRRAAERPTPDRWLPTAFLGATMERIVFLPGGSADAREAVAQLRKGLALMPEDAPARTRATLMQNVAAGLSGYADKQDDVASWRAAIAAAREAAVSISREQYPQRWAVLHQMIGEGLSREAQKLEPSEAKRAYVEAENNLGIAAQILSRDKAAGRWASLQLTTAEVLYAQSMLSKNPDRLMKALVTTRAAMGVSTRDVDPESWLELRLNEARVLAALADFGPLMGRDAARSDALAIAKEALTAAKAAKDTARLEASQAVLDDLTKWVARP